MKRDRKKTTHTQGVVAQISWVPVLDNGYSGFYAEGSTNAYIRFSQTVNLTTESNGLLPSLAIKFLRTGDMSVNLFAMPSFKETDSWDFFDNTMMSRLAPFVPADDEGNQNDQELIDTI